MPTYRERRSVLPGLRLMPMSLASWQAALAGGPSIAVDRVHCKRGIRLAELSAGGTTAALSFAPGGRAKYRGQWHAVYRSSCAWHRREACSAEPCRAERGVRGGKGEGRAARAVLEGHPASQGRARGARSVSCPWRALLSEGLCRRARRQEGDLTESLPAQHRPAPREHRGVRRPGKVGIGRLLSGFRCPDRERALAIGSLIRRDRTVHVHA